jgi:hypothetical protein
MGNAGHADSLCASRPGAPRAIRRDYVNRSRTSHEKRHGRAEAQKSLMQAVDSGGEGGTRTLDLGIMSATL